ncbi:MAG: hypothetical protein Unbinned3891contig1000_81 [Prokaryotic dsDNA virus sp.]|nr:MAG: hypothetical protein Unbinned3891contig1000_81 [Prokaryotic dsDNA virus sp.]|tara:strand:- start:45254 stop:45649 length:396 start_codon:yes stop_codon:yes gene_type:complete
MRKYKVLIGIHIEQGEKFTKGQVVTSHRPLAQLFRNKFEDLGEVPMPKTTVVESIPAAPSQREEVQRPAPSPVPAPPVEEEVVGDEEEEVVDEELEEEEEEEVSAPAPAKKASRPASKKTAKKRTSKSRKR